MRIAVLADIHSNILALDAVLRDADSWRPDHWVCLGDVVGYGPDPGPCLARMREYEFQCVQGNHEAALLGLETGQFNRVAQAAIDYCRRVLGPEEVSQVGEFVEALSFGDEATFVHGSIFDRDEYLFHRPQMKAVLARQTTRMCFFGHTHQQLYFDGDNFEGGPREIELAPEGRFLVNPGSAGQPRDGDPRAAYARVDVDTGVLELCRAEYDIEAVVKRVEEVGLPSYLGQRLLVGR